MYQIILVSHGKLAEGILDSAQLIFGMQEDVKTFSLCLGDDIEIFRNKVTAVIEESLKEGDVLVLTDIQSGSPFNVAVGAMTKNNFYHITGMNLAILIEALDCRENCKLEEIMDVLTETGKSGVVNVNRLILERQEEED